MPVVSEPRLSGYLNIVENIRRALNQTRTATATVSNISSVGAQTSSSSSSDLLSSQWTNPSDVLSVLLIIGGDVVRKALAQTAEGLFTPVCFSFGWVAYSFTAILGIVGDGRLLPEPDYPVKVFNLKNGYARENKNWLIGRLLRDNEMRMSKRHPLHGSALRISVYEAKNRVERTLLSGFDRVRQYGLAVMVLQLGVAAIPLGLYGEWGIFMITGAGTVLAQVFALLPQWKAEKMPSRRQSKKNFALTSGNGSRDIMIVLGCGESLDLEELSGGETPRSTRLWDKFELLSKKIMENGKQKQHSDGSLARKTMTYSGIPVGFWITIIVCSVQCLFWLALLISVAGLRSHTWYLLLVGGIGMFQNAMVAAISRDPKHRNLPLVLVDTIVSRELMDGLMDLEITYGDFGRHLVGEFFPGELRKDEKDWFERWKRVDGKSDGGIGDYDEKRKKEADRRGFPRSMLPRYHIQVDKEKEEPPHKAEATATGASTHPDQAGMKKEAQESRPIREASVATLRKLPGSRSSPDAQSPDNSQRRPLSGSTNFGTDVQSMGSRNSWNLGLQPLPVHGGIGSRENVSSLGPMSEAGSPDRRQSANLSIDEMYKPLDWAG